MTRQRSSRARVDDGSFGSASLHDAWHESKARDGDEEERRKRFHARNPRRT